MSTIFSLNYLISYYNLTIIFLIETLVHNNKIDEFRYVLGFKFYFSVGRSGRLALLLDFVS